jgi:hypothetical protein
LLFKRMQGIGSSRGMGRKALRNLYTGEVWERES